MTLVEQPNRTRVFGLGDVFAVMWAPAHLAHIALHTGTGANASTIDGTELLVGVAAVAVVARPRSARLLILLALAQLIDWLSVAPFNPDHWTLVAAVNVTLLLVWAASRRRDGVDVVERAAPALRWLLLIAYGAAALAKWNWGFLSVASSCAVHLGNLASFGLPGAVPGGEHLVIALVLGIETTVFALLVVPRTRRHGVRLGLVFHGLLSLGPVVAVWDFTATLAALFLLFLPRAEIDAAVRRILASTEGSPVIAVLAQHRWVVPLWLLAVSQLADADGLANGQLLVWASFTPYMVAVAWAVLPAAIGPAASPAVIGPPATSTARSVPVAALPAIAFLAFTAANPYLGLRTTGAFTMFSNLRTEGSGGNHLLVEGWHPTDHQNELVTLESATDPALQALADDRQGLPVSALRTLPLLVADETIVGTVEGRTVRWTDGDSERLVGAPSPFERWLLSFRPVPLDGHPPCRN